MIKATFLLFTLSLANVAVACIESNAAGSDFPESLTIASDSTTGIHAAWYDGATDRYRHGVLGDAIEPSILRIKDKNSCTYTVELDTNHVFEDIAPRLENIDGKPGAEVITIRSHQNYGAQIAVFQLAENELKLLTTTPYIGTSNRWLAPVGIADFNNDGDVDIAFVDRPHLAKVLRLWSYRDGKLEQIVHESGYSNHRIGEDFISGGIKRCGDSITMITADASWSQIIETRLAGDQLISEAIGEFTGTESLSQATKCQ